MAGFFLKQYTKSSSERRFSDARKSERWGSRVPDARKFLRFPSYYVRKQSTNPEQGFRFRDSIIQIVPECTRTPAQNIQTDRVIHELQLRTFRLPKWYANSSSEHSDCQHGTRSPAQNIQTVRVIHEVQLRTFRLSK